MIQSQHRKGPRRGLEGGFTLMEVLLALAISAIVLAAIGGVFYSALRLRERTSAMLDSAAVMQQAVSVLRRDLQGAVAPGGEIAGYFQTPAGAGGMGQGGSLRFRTTTGALQDGLPWGDIQEVVYELRPPAQRNGGGGNDLIRSVSRNLLSSMNQPPEDQWLMGNVRSLDVACYDGFDWRETWDTSLANTNLPTAVRVRLQLAADQSTESHNLQTVEMIVPLTTQSRTNQIQTTGGVL